MKQKIWLTLLTGLAYCIDKELYRAIDYLREQVRVLVEHQEKENKRILLTNGQRMRVGYKKVYSIRSLSIKGYISFGPDLLLSNSRFGKLTRL